MISQKDEHSGDDKSASQVKEVGGARDYVSSLH